MGQKVNPIGLRLGINRTWDSRWYRRQERIRQAAARGHEDPRGPDGGPEAGGVVEDRDRAPAQEVPRHDPFGAPGRGDRQEGRRHREAAQEGREADRQSKCIINIVEIRKPEIDAQLVAEIDRPAARAPRGVPPRHEARGAVGDAAGRGGHPHQLLGPPRRRRNRAHGVVSRRPRAAAYAARRRRLRRRDRVHHLRHLRRQGLDLQGRDPGARPDGAGQAAWPKATSRPRRGRDAA